MEDLMHALLIIFSFGAIFLIIMTIEHKVLIKQGQAGYDLPETAANIASSVLYKVMDGVYIVLFLGTLAHYVHSHGLQIEFEFHWYTYVLIFFGARLFVLYLAFFGAQNPFGVGAAQDSPFLKSFQFRRGLASIGLCAIEYF